MKVFEKFASVATVAGFGFFTIAFLTIGVVPWFMTNRVAPVKTGVDFDTTFLPPSVPIEFREKYTNLAEYKNAIDAGRKIYIAEACWHCHTQYVRPVGNEVARYGPVSENWEYQNEMNLPQLFGTRRVGPDLTREWDRHNSDWHFAHFKNPVDVVPESIMPRYDWFFDKDGKPNDRGWAITAYVMWLGSWRRGEPGVSIQR